MTFGPSLIFVATLAAAPALAEAPLVNATGTVVERIRVWADGGLPTDLAKVRTQDGRVLVADLGVPGGEATIQEGDRVVVTGRALEVGDRTLVVTVMVVEAMNRGDREAQDRTGRQAFALLDDDANGLLSREEAARVPALWRQFERLDRDGDRALSRMEATRPLAQSLRSG